MEDYPGWKDWQLKKIKYTLLIDDKYFASNSEPIEDFIFSEEIDKQYTIVFRFIGLEESLISLKECEYYFRRFPFQGLPVSKSDHLRNICEMYFGRFYEFRERLKKFLNSVNSLYPESKIDVGKILKIYDNFFDYELRARNRVHHDERFNELALSKISITGIVSKNEKINKTWDQENKLAYRKATSEWVKRVRNRSNNLETFLEFISNITLDRCAFLKSEISKK